MTEFGTIQRAYELLIWGWVVYAGALMLDKASREGWIRGAVDAIGRFVKYTVLQQPRKGGAG